MSNVYLPHSAEQHPGTWQAGEGYTQIVCPKCGKVAILDHEIAADGTVTPSVACPRAGCDWHEMVVLVGWNMPDVQVHLTAYPDLDPKTVWALSELIKAAAQGLRDGTIAADGPTLPAQQEGD